MLWFSPALLAELREVLMRPELRIKRHQTDELINLLMTRAKLVVPTTPLHACRDPKDDIVLQCAVAGRVNVIVTGDSDLLALHPFRSIAILAPSQFLHR